MRVRTGTAACGNVCSIAASSAQRGASGSLSQALAGGGRGVASEEMEVSRTLVSVPQTRQPGQPKLILRSGGWKSRIKVLAGSVPWEASLLAV